MADRYECLVNIARFPAVDSANQTQCTSWEFLSPYDRIVLGKFRGEEKSVWMVGMNERT